jgi:hypothetical protein
MKRQLLLGAIPIFTMSTVAGAQSFPVPTDIQAFSGSTGYTAVVPTASTNNAVPNVPIDAYVTYPPAGNGMTNIPVPSQTNRVLSTAFQDGSTSTFCASPTYSTPNCGRQIEAKERLQFDYTTMLPVDPIRNFGNATLTHLHQFGGNASCNPNSTYKSLRAHSQDSHAMGADGNASCYWWPALMVQNRDVDGYDWAIIPDGVTLYYTGDPIELQRAPHVPTGLREVSGFDMDATWNGTSFVQYAWMQTYINQMNAASAAAGGSSSRYSQPIIAPNGPANFRYNCEGVGFETQLLTTSGGADPFGGLCEYGRVTASISGTVMTVTGTLTGHSKILTGQRVVCPGCTAGTTISSYGTGTGGTGTYNVSASQTVASTTIETMQNLYIRVDGQKCWDGVNLWSPGGYKHFIFGFQDIFFAGVKCPTNYYQLPAVTLELQFTQYGWPDRQRWVLSSDLALRSKFSLNATQVPAGTSFHYDRVDGWDFVIRDMFSVGCNGVMRNPPHECQIGQVAADKRLSGQNGDPLPYITPVVDFSANPRVNGTDAGWKKIPLDWSAALNMQGMH